MFDLGRSSEDLIVSDKDMDKDERRRELGRVRSARFYRRNQEMLQKKAYFRCLQKGLIKIVRPSTALKYGLVRSEGQELKVF